MTSNPAAPLFFDGFASPNFTQVPDELFDVLLPRLSDCELRVLLYIVRRTFGFKRDADTIALSQMVHGITTRDGQVLDSGTGLSKATVARGLAGLRAKGIIEAERRTSVQRGNEATLYRLRFKTSAPVKAQVSASLSHQRDKDHSRSLVSSARQAVSQPRDTQETGEQQTDFEISKEGNLVDKTEMGQGRPDQIRSNPDHSGSRGGMEPITATLQRRVVRQAVSDDRQAIAATIHMIADELGDRANRKSTITRATNLFAQSGVGRELFVDAMYLAKGEVCDRRRDPGTAPVPGNQMAYFFAVLEDRLGLRAPTSG